MAKSVQINILLNPLPFKTPLKGLNHTQKLTTIVHLVVAYVGKVGYN